MNRSSNLSLKPPLRPLPAPVPEPSPLARPPACLRPSPPSPWAMLPNHQQQEIVIILAGMLHKYLHQQATEQAHD